MICACETENDKVSVMRCYGFGTEAELPETIGGCPVTGLGAYAFSSHIEGASLESGLKKGRFFLWDTSSDRPFESTGQGGVGKALEGSGLIRVSLPSCLNKIGAYAFYDCGSLKSLSFYGGLSDLGAGLFTGCHRVNRLHVSLDESQTSCLREMLMELPEKLTVRMSGSLDAVLIFPEFFEESVENTPARILMTRMHGSGMNYRNCFYARKFDFRAYDACFLKAAAWEDFETLLEISLSRLMFPAGLTAESRGAYERWICENIDAALKSAVTARDMAAVEFLSCSLRTTAAQIKTAAAYAAAEDFAEASAFLMNVLRKKEPPAKNSLSSGRFEL